MKTLLYDRHVALKAKMISFAGWEMPIHYRGVLAEHQAVRQAAGLFDVSHMGRIMITGADAGNLLDWVSTNRISDKKMGTATYTVWCHSHGGSVDDLIVYKIDDTHYFVVANASNRDKDLMHLKTQAKQKHFDVNIKDCFNGTGILALQGPSALPLLTALIPSVQSIKPMQFLSFDTDSYISRTGYTGAGGFELYGSNEQIITWWDRLLDKGKDYGLEPAGLGARDTLRLEMGFALYGHELSDAIAPSESVSAWTVKWDKTDFLGKEALEKLEQSPTKRFAYGIRLLEKGIPRQGCLVLQDENPIGEVTSGSFSPILNDGIALILISKPLQVGNHVTLQIRQTACRAQVVELPFIRKQV